MLVEIKQKSWEKYNPRNDAKKWSWFRFENDFFDDDLVEELPPNQKLLLIYLLTRRNKAGKPVFEVSLTHAARRIPCTIEDVEAGLRALAACGLISLPPADTNADVRGSTGTNVPDTPRTDSFPTDGRTDERDETSNLESLEPPAAHSFDTAMAERWGEWARAQSRTVKPDLEEWADVFRKLRELDRFTEAEIEAVFTHVSAEGSWWADKALSVPSLRKRKDGDPSKFEKILKQVQSSSRGRFNGSSRPQQVIPVITGDNLDQLLGD